jgi:hypothetical protein
MTKTEKIQAVLDGLAQRKAQQAVWIAQILEQPQHDILSIEWAFEQMQKTDDLLAYVRSHSRQFLSKEEHAKIGLDVAVDMQGAKKPTLKVYVDGEEVVAVTSDDLAPVDPNYVPRKTPEPQQELKVWSQTQREAMALEEDPEKKTS